jgi:amidohydrolase
MTDPVEAVIRAVLPRVLEQRRDFHRHPELAFEEVRTSAKVVEWCASLGLELQTGVGRTGVVARLRGARPGKVVALRADMDALPIQEANEHGFQSVHAGKMHACGHDAHTAMLLGVASALAAQRASIAGEVRFLFQPAEEGLGGAVPMIESGALEGVDMIFAQHMGPTHPTGTIAVSHGPAMAATDFFTLRILGRGGHGAYPHLSIDSIPIAAQVVTALQTIVSRAVDPLQAAVVTIGTIKGGFRSNVIAPQVELTGTVRTFDAQLREAMPRSIERIVRGIVDAHGARHELDYTMNYPSVVNDDAATQALKGAAAEVVGPDRVRVIPPSMGGEDFAYYAERVPGCFYWLGCRKPEQAETVNLHSPDFDLDEDALELGIRVMVRAATRFLAAP